MPGLRQVLAAALIACGLSAPQALRADCVEIGEACIGNNDLKAQIRIGTHTPDLQRLAQFTQLSDLTLLADLHYDTPVDLAPLAALTNLERLALVNVTAASLAPLTKLPELKRLSLDFVHAPDFAPLAAMTGLEHLSVWGIEEVTSLAFARGMTRLQSLNIADSGISDLNPLADLQSLEIFLAFNTRVADLSPLARSNLRVAWVSNCPVESVAALAGSTNLEMLRADGTRLQSLEGLQNKPQLQTLILSDTGVADLAPIAGAVTLSELALDGTPVSDITPLAGLDGLRKLTLKGSAVSSLAPLAGKNLHKLSIADTAVSSLAAVQDMHELREFNASGTRVTDLAPLAELKALSILRVVGLPPGILPPLLKARNLRILFAGRDAETRKRLLGKEQITAYISALPN